MKKEHWEIGRLGLWYEKIVDSIRIVNAFWEMCKFLMQLRSIY